MKDIENMDMTLNQPNVSQSSDQILLTEDTDVDPLLEQQWEEYQHSLVDECTAKYMDPEWRELDRKSSSNDQIKYMIVNDLNNVSKMTVEEYTLYLKWCEIQEKYPGEIKRTLTGDHFVYDNPEHMKLIRKIKHNIWTPKNPDDFSEIEALKPRLILCNATDVGDSVTLDGTETKNVKNDPELAKIWNCIRTFISTMKNSSNIGRNLRYLVVDETSGKYLGVICISSDFMDLTPRDKYIGWDRELKTKKMINHTAIGSTIVPFQPLGYNAVGGKLLALLCLSNTVREDWERLYGDKLAGVTTTSLYGKNKIGGMSQYDGLKHWKKMGFSAGSVAFECRKITIKAMTTWLEKNYPRKYFEWYVATKPSGQPYKRDHRNRSFTFIYNKLDIPKDIQRTDHARGIYFSELYENTNEYLRGEIDESKLVVKVDGSYEYLTKLWLDKYARKRYKSLKSQNREFMTDFLFYDDLSWKDWFTAKDDYLGQVGR